jgi:ribonuclease R
MKRGTSVYFTDKVVPMLPKVISNGVCSLNAGEKKYTLSAIMHLNNEGDIVDARIEKSFIVSNVRGVYSEVNKILSGEADGAISEKYKSVLPMLKKMEELYEILARKSEARGALELETHEAEILLDAQGNPCDIVYRERGVAERMIEQFMLCANEAVACELTKRKIPLVYRVHEAPPEEKLDSFLQFVHNLGYDTSLISKEKVEPRDFGALLKKAEEDGTLVPVSYTMLRSMSKAKYSDIQHSHFGLAIENYCHFTSPIRRLSDLATHRIIHKVLLDGKSPEIYRSYAKRAAVAATDAELRAIGAERRIENLYKTIYMSNKIGEEFSATVVSITSFGIFAELENTCEGLLPIADLPGSFVYDEKNLSLRSHDAVYRIGERIHVCVEEADIPTRRVRFSLVTEEENA